MKPISPRPILKLSFFTSSNQKIINNSLFFLTQSFHNAYHSRRQDEESRAVRVSVWWDFENCNAPVNTNAFRVAQCVTNAVRANGIRGPIQITAFGDVMQLSRTNQEALSSTGINFTHVPSGGKNSADRSLLVDLMYWVSQNPPPAHIFLISGDRDFAGILHRLRMNNYNILLASPDSAPNVLCSASTIMWQWSSLLKGENLSGKLFNQPPDGPYHSWYGHYKAPLEDPFTTAGHSSCLVADESHDLSSDSKLFPIPKTTEQSSSFGADESIDVASHLKAQPFSKAAVKKHIIRILKSNPEGISISQLGQELSKINSIDKGFYGFKKFSRFLESMPQILELQYLNDGSIFVRSVNTKSIDESVSAANVEPGTNRAEPEVGSISNTCDEGSSSEDVTEKSIVHLALDPKMKAETSCLLESKKDGKQDGTSQSVKMQVNNGKGCGANLQDLKKDEGRKAPLPKRITQEIHEQDKNIKLQNQSEKVEVNPPVVELKDLSEKIENELLVPNDHKYTFGFGIFRRIWMKFFGSRDTKLDDASSGEVTVAKETPASYEVEKKDETNDHFEVNSKGIDMLSEESFWKEIESFIGSPEVSALISKSRTREFLALNLQKQGPAFLRSLSESDILHLVDLLISEKKWVEECNSRIFPFRLARSVGTDSHKNPPSSPNGLSQIFSGSQTSTEPGERKHRIPHTGVSHPIIQSGASRKSRSEGEVLADCQKLVDFIVKEHPEGFNTGRFRKLFIEKHGYALDLPKLGYNKLMNLLHTMSGARIESNLIFPAGALKNLDFPSNVDHPLVDSLTDSSPKDDDSDSSFDELGSVDISGSETEETDARMSGKNAKERAEQKLPDYEPLTEDDFSDSEEETPLTRSGDKSRVKVEEESALMEILDSWYIDSKKNGPANATNGQGIVSQPLNVNLPHKRKSGKTYSFVTDQPVDKKDKLVDGILDSLKRSDDKPADSKVLS